MPCGEQEIFHKIVPHNYRKLINKCYYDRHHYKLGGFLLYISCLLTILQHVNISIKFHLNKPKIMPFDIFKAIMLDYSNQKRQHSVFLFKWNDC